MKKTQSDGIPEPAEEGPQPADKRKMVIDSIVEGRKMEAYAEHRTKEMHACWMCGAICYRKKAARNIGERWICIDCLKQLKESLDTLSQWEESIALQRDITRQLDDLKQ
jgi:predicted RNA-binding Zn-ribbon protein involved in translation (DUF1610 family)